MKKLTLFVALAIALGLAPVRAAANGETISPNMGLSVPAVGVTIGPDWASDINISLGLIDAHDHSPGNGVQITPSGLNISSDLSFIGNNLTTARSVRFSAQSSPLAAAADVGAIYESGVDLYYNDGNGNQVRITQSGSVAGSAGTITGLPSGTASAAFSAASGTFVFQQATSTAANMDIGSLILRYPGSYPTPAGNSIAFQAPTTLATGYAFTFPNTLPGSSGAWITSSTSGALSYTNVDNSSVEISSSTLRVKANGIQGPMLNSNVVDNSTLQYTSSQLSIKNSGVGTSQIADGAVTIAKMATPTIVYSSGSGGFNAATPSSGSVTGMSLSFTSTGKPLFLAVVPYAGGSQLINGGGGTWTLTRDSGSLVVWTNLNSQGPMIYVDTPSVGAHTYAIIYADGSGTSVNFQFSKLMAYELP